jgi:hypothetical protein
MTELLGRAGLMAVGTETADVAVLVATALGERHDVVGHGGFADETPGSAVLAERLSPQTSQPLLHRLSSSLAFDHKQGPKRTTPESHWLRAQFSSLYFGRFRVFA